MGGTFRNVHCRPWNMASKLKIMENEKHPIDSYLLLTRHANTLKREKTLKERDLTRGSCLRREQTQ